MMNVNEKRGKEWRMSRLAYLISCQIFIFSVGIPFTYARDYFNPALIEQNGSASETTDLSAFENQNGQIPGNYRVDIFINDEKVTTRTVEFRLFSDKAGKKTLFPCLSVSDLANWGVQTDKFPDIGKSMSGCANLFAISQASADFRFDRQQLLLSFPQSAVKNSARGWVDPELWDDGIPAALLNYSINGANNTTKSGQGYDSNSQYISLRPGINIGAWRLRNYTTWMHSGSDAPEQKSTNKWDTLYTYAQRDIKSLDSQLTLGDSTSSADVFNSIPFRGAQLASDDDMLPESLRGYAPTIRGIARSNAQVTVRQNGYIVYQTYVSPGSFEINDMYPTGGSGDFNVTIKESDGSEQYLVVPYASLPVLQREGRLKYSVTSAAYRSYDNNVDKTPFTQGTLIYGLPSGFTAYGGGQFASKYQSLALGLGKNLGDFGALSTDVIQAWSKQQDLDKESGRSFSVRYSKNIVGTGTNFAIAGYRYATNGYWDMSEVLETYRSNLSAPLLERRRNRAEMNVSQSLGKNMGNLSLTAIWEDYWNTNRRMESYGASYNNSWNDVSYGLNYTYSLNSAATGFNDGGNDHRIFNKDQFFAFNISVPLDKLFNSNSRHPIYANYMLNTSKNGNTTNNIGLGGTVLEDNNLSWGVGQGYSSQGQGNSGNVNADWRATYGEVTGGYGYDKYNRRLNYGVQGGIVAHSEGVTLSQPLSETVALIAAPGADGISVTGRTGVKTDFRGYTVVPYTSPYRKNDISLNTETFGDNTEVAVVTQTVIPTRGAVVKASYQTSVGKRGLMILLRPNGLPVPFGATASVVGDKNEQGSIVGDGGQVYLTGLEDTGHLNVKWGNDISQQCHAEYQLRDDKQQNSGVFNVQIKCI